MKQFFSRLNIRLLIIHFLALTLFTFSFHVLASLYDYQFLYGKSAIPNFMDTQRHNRDLRVIEFAGSIGQIIAFLLSWQLSSKRNWFWVNPIIVFVIAFTLGNFNLLGWLWMRDILLLPGSVFGTNSIAGVLINGVIMLAAGLFLFYNPKMQRFIDQGAVKYPDTKPVINVKTTVTGKKK